MADLVSVEQAIFARLRSELSDVTVERFVGEPIEAAEEAARKVRGSTGVVLLLYGGTTLVERPSYNSRRRQSAWTMVVAARNLRTDAEAQAAALVLLERLIAALDNVGLPTDSDPQMTYSGDRLIAVADHVAAYEVLWELAING